MSLWTLPTLLSAILSNFSVHLDRRIRQRFHSVFFGLLVSARNQAVAVRRFSRQSRYVRHRPEAEIEDPCKKPARPRCASVMQSRKVQLHSRRILCEFFTFAADRIKAYARLCSIFLCR